MKALAILLLTAVIFGGAAYFTYDLFFKRQQLMQEEKGQTPPAPPPDPTLPDFQKCLALQDSAPVLQVRAAWLDFVERYPQSSRIEEAKGRLGQLNSTLYLSPVETPDKTSYVVQRGDVITRVAAKANSTPELIMQVNNLHISNVAGGRNLILRIGQRLVITPSNFSLLIERKSQKVVLLQKGKFFKQYPIISMPERKKAAAVAEKKPAAATPRPPKLEAKVTDRIAWHDQQRVIYTDKDYADAEHWIVITPGGHSLYAEVPAQPGGPPPRVPNGGGYGLTPNDAREIAVLLRRNDPVTID